MAVLRHDNYCSSSSLFLCIEIDVVLQEDTVRREDANECEGGTVLVQYEEVRRGTKRDEFTAVEKVLRTYQLLLGVSWLFLGFFHVFLLRKKSHFPSSVESLNIVRGPSVFF